MKKLLRNFAILTIFACGLFTGCNNDDADIDLNVTVSTDKPSLDEPKNLGYGVLLTWRVTQDFGRFRITRQAKDGEEKIIGYVGNEYEENRFFDIMAFYNELKEGVEYTYRVYNLGDADTVYGDNYVVKTSYAERKITLQAGSLKKQGDKLEAINKDNVKTSFKNGVLCIYLNDENSVGTKDIVVKDAETGKKVERDADSHSYCSFSNIPVQKVNVEIKNVSNDGYYADSDVVTIENIENTSVEESIYISNLAATVRDKTVVLLWTTKEKVEPSEFTIQRTKNNDSSKPEILKITPTYEQKYDGTYYWKAVDETVADGTLYTYRVRTDSNSRDVSVSVPGGIEILSVRYSNVDNTVTLQWKAENGVSDFKIYRADGNLSGEDYNALDENKYYDLYKPLDITFEKVDSTIDDNKEVQAVYIAKDTTVEKSKDYTYRITSTDGLDCSWNYSVRTSDVSSYSISLDVSVNGSSYSSISNEKDDILLSFEGDKNVTYKGYWTTVDNKGNESTRTDFAFTKDNDEHYRKAFKASNFTNLDKSVSVNFYVKCYDGDKLLGHWDSDLSEYVYEYNKSVPVSPSLTTYTTFYKYDFSASQEDYSKKEITISAIGYNFDKVIKVTYFKDGEEEIKTANLTWTKALSNQYEAKFTVTETGYYTICATIPKDNAHPYSELSAKATLYVN
ncbi:MAG: hypothetical protein HDR51_03875 [Treponema sp.]|nr:hypothetical protein [Treponema sp.]